MFLFGAVPCCTGLWLCQLVAREASRSTKARSDAEMTSLLHQKAADAAALQRQLEVAVAEADSRHRSEVTSLQLGHAAELASVRHAAESEV